MWCLLLTCYILNTLSSLQNVTKEKVMPIISLRIHLKNTTIASKTCAPFVWVSSNYNTVIFSDKKSEDIDSYKHWSLLNKSRQWEVYGVRMEQFPLCVFLFITDHGINDSILLQTVAELMHTYSQKDKSVPCLVLGIMYLLRIKNVLALFGGETKKECLLWLLASYFPLPIVNPIILPLPRLARIESFI
jgi:hypothetical protein